MNEPIEQEIQARGADKAPRITPADVELNVVSEHYFTAAQGAHAAWMAEPRESTSFAAADVNGPLSLLTFCVLILRNGFTVTGESACASPENFNEQIGRKVARDNAINKIWPLMGYELRSKLAAQRAETPLE